MSDISEYKCPCCGGTLQFDSSTQNVTCPYCDSTFTAEDLKNLDNEIKNDFNQDIDWKNEVKEMYTEEEIKGMDVYLCDACGGEIITSENTASTSCPYCGNNILIKSKLSGALKPQICIPFKKNKDEACDGFKKYFKKKVFMVGDFKKNCKIDETQSIYVPYWIYNADVDGKVRFTGEKTRRWSDSEYNYKEVQTYSIYRKGHIAFDNIPVDASKRMPNDLMESIEPFDAKEHKDFSVVYLAGYNAEKYDVSNDDCEDRANKRIKEGTIDALRKTVKGYSNVKDRESSFTLSNQTSKYALYPIWILNISWKENKYMFAVNGETGKVAGKYPVSKLKYALFVLLQVLLFIGGIFSFYYFLTDNTFGDCLLVALVIGSLVTFAISFIVGRKLKERVSLKHGANNYERPGSFVLHEQHSHLISKRVTKSKKSK